MAGRQSTPGLGGGQPEPPPEQYRHGRYVHFGSLACVATVGLDTDTSFYEQWRIQFSRQFFTDAICPSRAL
eukprot:8676657-Pyramimonas_sp.AAC.1